MNAAETSPLARPPHRLPAVWVGVLLSLIVFVGAGLRWHGIGRESLFLDEFWFEELSTGRGSSHWELPRDVVIEAPPRLTSPRGQASIVNVWTRLDEVLHPPLYPLVLRVWRDVFGESDRTARALSALLSLAGVVLLFDLVRLTHGASAGLWAAAIMSVAGSQIMMSQEVRGYTLTVAFALAGANALVRLERSPPGSWKWASVFGVAMFAVMLTHYLAIGTCAALGAFAIWRLRAAARKQAVIAMVAAAVVYLVIWGPFLLRQRAGLVGNIWFLADDPHAHAWQTVIRTLAIPLRLLFEPLQGAAVLSYLSGLLYVMPLLLLRRRRDLLLYTLWLCATVGVVTVSDLWNTSFMLTFLRYTAPAGPGVFALLAIFASKSSRAWQRHAVPASAVLACVLALEAAYSRDTADWKATANFLNRSLKPGEVLVFYKADNTHLASAHILNLSLSHYLNDPLNPVAFLTGPADDKLLARLRAAPAVWFITRQQNVSPESLFPGQSIATSTSSDAYYASPLTATCQRVKFVE